MKKVREEKFVQVFNPHKSSTPVANDETNEGVTHRYGIIQV